MEKGLLMRLRLIAKQLPALEPDERFYLIDRLGQRYHGWTRAGVRIFECELRLRTAQDGRQRFSGTMLHQIKLLQTKPDQQSPQGAAALRVQVLCVELWNAAAMIERYAVPLPLQPALLETASPEPLLLETHLDFGHLRGAPQIAPWRNALP
jgi:hypothetical protein